MQVLTFLLLLLTITQYAEVQAQLRRKRQEQELQQIDIEDIDELAEDLLEIEGLKSTTQHNLLDEIEAAQQIKQQYEYEIQQQQEKLRKLQEQYEFELLEEQKKQQDLLQQRQYAREQDKLRLRQYALRQRQKLEKFQQEEREKEKQQQEYDPNTEFGLVDNASESNFYEHHNDGTYAFGYALPNGVRRFERSYYADEVQGMLVEGFYAEIRDRGTHKEYELHCYRSGPFGYRPMPVRALDYAPLVHRNTTLDDDCFDK